MKLHPLPPETIFEARDRARKEIFRLSLVLFAVYIVFFNLSSLLTLLFFRFVFFHSMNPNFLLWNFAATILAVLFAKVHFSIARSRPLMEILATLGAAEADLEDRYHQRFRHVVQEAGLAIGEKKILPVVLPSLGLNAFSIQDGFGKMAIGVTEGALANMSRQELTAMVCHEAAHLAHEDSKNSALVSSLVEVFNSPFSVSNADSTVVIRGRRMVALREKGILRGILFSAFYFLGLFFTSVFSMAISRKREFLADAHAILISYDPISLARAIHKMSGRYRAGDEVPRNYGCLFFLNPSFQSLDEKNSLAAHFFSAHPPIADRIQKILEWAKKDISVLDKRKRGGSVKEKEDASPMDEFYIHHEGKWQGPYELERMKMLEFMTPLSWIFESGVQEIRHASDFKDLRGFFQTASKHDSSTISAFHCPRCKTGLSKGNYEGAPIYHCSFCEGDLLPQGVLERIIARREEKFSLKRIEEAKAWRCVRRGGVSYWKEFPLISCPLCKVEMSPFFYSELTKVVLDRCLNPSCGAIWCDRNELETIQILVEHGKELKV